MKKLIVGILTICLMILTASCSADASRVDSSNEDNEVLEVNEEPEVETIQAYGVVDFKEEQSISVDFNARIDKIHVKEGEQISLGEPLVDFDISELKNTIDSKCMAIDETKYKLERNDYRAEQLNIGLQNEKDSLFDLENQLQKIKILFDKGAASQDEIDQIEDKIRQKERQIEQLFLNIKDTQNQVQEDHKILSNQLIQFEDELRNLEEKYTKANFKNENQIVSDIENGVVTAVHGKEGSFVNREHNIMTIVDLDSRVVQADIAEEFISRIKVGQNAIVTSQAVPGYEYTGEIIRIWGTSIKKGGETIVPIEIELENIDDRLFLNFNVDVTIELE